MLLLLLLLLLLLRLLVEMLDALEVGHEGRRVEGRGLGGGPRGGVVAVVEVLPVVVLVVVEQACEVRDPSGCADAAASAHRKQDVIVVIVVRAGAKPAGRFVRHLVGVLKAGPGRVNPEAATHRRGKQYHEPGIGDNHAKSPGGDEKEKPPPIPCSPAKRCLVLE
jgi:hypothetical protein